MKPLRLFAAFFSLAALCSLCASAAISISAATNELTYFRGEAMDVSVTAHNSDSFPVTLGFGSTLQSQYILDGTYSTPDIGATVLTYRTIPANGSYTWTHRHNWNAFDLGLGPHTAVGRVVGYGDSLPSPFAIVPSPPPPTSVHADFEYAPGSAKPLGSVSEYWPFGVQFTSLKSDGTRKPAAIQQVNGNKYIHGPGGPNTYPVGFNIIADFDQPMTSASVDVFAGLGETVTMIAKDAGGNVIGSVTSAPTTSLYDFDPLFFSSAIPFKTLEWWPSVTNSGVNIDNLSVHAPEPTGLTLLALATAACVRRRR